MGFIKKEHHPRLLLIPSLREQLEELRHHPQHKRGIDQRALDLLAAVQDMDHALPARIGAHPVMEVQSRLPKKLLTALGLQRDHRAEDGIDTLFGQIAVPRGILLRIFRYMLEHGPQVLSVDQKQLVLVSDPKDDRQDIALDLGQA